jgi:PTH1 family peptidyl-tRNA hydrolase
MLIVGLGNPGAEYEWTRHNLGFMLVDRLAREMGALVKRKECRALVGRAELEGESVACLIDKRHEGRAAGAKELLVVSDDLALPFGTIRLRGRGSAGGHNGLKSIIAALKTEEFARLRIGIQPPHPVGDTKRFVLEEFSRAERAEVEKILERSADALRAILRDGIDKAMAIYNSDK